MKSNAPHDDVAGYLAHAVAHKEQAGPCIQALPRLVRAVRFGLSASG